VDIVRGELVEKELDAMIQCSGSREPDPDEKAHCGRQAFHPSRGGVGR